MKAGRKTRRLDLENKYGEHWTTPGVSRPAEPDLAERRWAIVCSTCTNLDS